MSTYAAILVLSSSFKSNFFPICSFESEPKVVYPL